MKTTKSDNYIYSTISVDDISKYNIVSPNNDSREFQFHPTREWKEFETHMPDLTTVKNMCNKYPAMQRAYDHFVITYLLLKDDYDTEKK